MKGRAALNLALLEFEIIEAKSDGRFIGGKQLPAD